jgi:hypothetical protein
VIQGVKGNIDTDDDDDDDDVVVVVVVWRMVQCSKMHVKENKSSRVASPQTPIKELEVCLQVNTAMPSNC